MMNFDIYAHHSGGGLTRLVMERGTYAEAVHDAVFELKLIGVSEDEIEELVIKPYVRIGGEK